MNSITQNMRYLQSLMKYAEKCGAKAAGRKYNCARSFICFRQKRRDGTEASLQYRSKRPHSHLSRHTEEELKLIWDMRRRNPQPGMIEFRCRLRDRGYSRRVESLYRVMKREGMMPQKRKEGRISPSPMSR